MNEYQKRALRHGWTLVVWQTELGWQAEVREQRHCLIGIAIKDDAHKAARAALREAEHD